jgi:hypothetical protein
MVGDQTANHTVKPLKKGKKSPKQYKTKNIGSGTVELVFFVLMLLV